MRQSFDSLRGYVAAALKLPNRYDLDVVRIPLSGVVRFSVWDKETSRSTSTDVSEYAIAQSPNLGVLLDGIADHLLREIGMGKVLELDLNYRNRRMLDLARDQPCINCGKQDGTTVPAHSNQSVHGKGKSVKAHDCFFIPLCHTCHAWLDQGTGADPTKIWEGTREGKAEMFNACMHDWWLKMWRAGWLEVK